MVGTRWVIQRNWGDDRSTRMVLNDLKYGNGGGRLGVHVSAYASPSARSLLVVTFPDLNTPCICLVFIVFIVCRECEMGV